MYGLGKCETFENLKFKQSVNGFKNLATGVITYKNNHRWEGVRVGTPNLR